MRALSQRQAATCENAKGPKCRCRCGGDFHGKARIGQDAPREDFERLPDEDPHHLPEKRKGR